MQFSGFTDQTHKNPLFLLSIWKISDNPAPKCIKKQQRLCWGSPEGIMAWLILVTGELAIRYTASGLPGFLLPHDLTTKEHISVLLCSNELTFLFLFNQDSSCSSTMGYCDTSATLISMPQPSRKSHSCTMLVLFPPWCS